MRTLIVVESMFGNTRQVADAIAGGIQRSGPVEVVDVTETSGTTLDGVDLLVVGGPTHAFGMTRSSTRADAVRQGASARGSDIGVREWLDTLPAAQAPRAAAVFDTRVHKVRHLPGSAAKAAGKAVRRAGCRLVVDPESFWVLDTSGPLVRGELDRARAWGERVSGAAARQHA